MYLRKTGLLVLVVYCQNWIPNYALISQLLNGKLRQNWPGAVQIVLKETVNTPFREVPNQVLTLVAFLKASLWPLFMRRKKRINSRKLKIKIYGLNFCHLLDSGARESPLC